MVVSITFFVLVGALFVVRPSVTRFIAMVWSDIRHIICCGLVALAITALMLNTIGLPPTSLFGSLYMGLVGCVMGALLLRWGETHY